MNGSRRNNNFVSVDLSKNTPFVPVYHVILSIIACKNSRPSSLPTPSDVSQEDPSRKMPLGVGSEGRLFLQAISIIMTGPHTSWLYCY